MEKKILKKIALKKETISNLNDNQMNVVLGGKVTIGVACQTWTTNATW